VQILSAPRAGYFASDGQQDRSVACGAGYLVMVRTAAGLAVLHI